MEIVTHNILTMIALNGEINSDNKIYLSNHKILKIYEVITSGSTLVANTFGNLFVWVKNKK